MYTEQGKFRGNCEFVPLFRPGFLLQTCSDSVNATYQRGENFCVDQDRFSKRAFVGLYQVFWVDEAAFLSAYVVSAQGLWPGFFQPLQTCSCRNPHKMPKLCFGL